MGLSHFLTMAQQVRTMCSEVAYEHVCALMCTALACACACACSMRAGVHKGCYRRIVSHNLASPNETRRLWAGEVYCTIAPLIKDRREVRTSRGDILRTI